MILKNLKSRMKVWFQSEKDYLEDRLLMEGLLVEDSVDEVQAYAYVLSSIAAIDGNFDKQEKNLVNSILLQLFPERKVDIPHLVSAAESMIANYRASDSFISKIKEEYSQEERQRLYDAIDKVITSDSKEDPMENFLRERFKKALL